MAEHLQKDNEGYEVSDVNTRLIWILLSVVGTTMVVAIIGVIFIMRGMEAQTARDRAGAVSPLDTAQAQIPTGGPLLQQDPVQEKRDIFKEMTDQLESYGSVRAPESDHVSLEESGTVIHIPIERAIELVGTHKVPYRQAPRHAILDAAKTSSGGTP